MSFEPYECLHVPVQAGKVRVFGLPVWVLLLAAAVVVGKLYGPWVFLAPPLALLAVTALVLAVRRWRRTHHPDPRHSNQEHGQGHGSGDGPGVPVDVLTGAPVVVLSTTGPLPCMGCGASRATAVVEVSGYRIPVCGPCHITAQVRIAEMVAAGRLPVLE